MAEVDVDVGSVIAGVGIPRVRQSGEESVQSLLPPLRALTSLTGINCSAYVQCVCEKNLLRDPSLLSFALLTVLVCGAMTTLDMIAVVHVSKGVD